MGLRQNALALILVTALMAVLGDWLGDPQLARLWCLPAGLLLAGLAYEAWIAARVAPRLTLSAPSRWPLGRATAVDFSVAGQLSRALSIEVAPAAPPEVTMDRSTRSLAAPARASAAWTLSATARRLGTFVWPPMQARVAGAFGLSWWPTQLRSAFALQVVPDVLRASELQLGAHARGVRAMPRASSGAEILQLRDYRPGDPLRSLDWKASARTRRLISRDYAEDQHLEIVLALDAGRSSALRAGDTDRLALYANIAARLAQRATLLDDRVGLLIYAERPLAAMVPGRGMSAVMRVRSMLAQARVQDQDGNPALAALRIRSLARQRSFVILLTDLDDASAAGELRNAVRLLLPKHLPFIAAVTSPAIAAVAAGAAADETGVYRALAAQEYVNTLTRNLASLKALGAPGVLAAPPELDAAVLSAYLNFRRRRRI